MHLSKESSILDSNGEGSTVVRTFFFNQQYTNKLAGIAEQNLAKSTNFGLILQQHYFQYQYTRLQRVCEKIKKDTQVRVAAIPVLEQQLWEPVIKSLNNITSATDLLLKVVAKSAREHRNDTTFLRTLSADLEVTSNLLSSPTTQNMEAFQKRANEKYGQHSLEKAGDSMVRGAMLGIGMAVFLLFVASMAVCVTASPALVILSLITFGSALSGLLLGSAVAKVGNMLCGPEVSYKNQILQEVSPYVRPTPKLS